MFSKTEHQKSIGAISHGARFSFTLGRPPIIDSIKRWDSRHAPRCGRVQSGLETVLAPGIRLDLKFRPELTKTVPNAIFQAGLPNFDPDNGTRTRTIRVIAVEEKL